MAKGTSYWIQLYRDLGAIVRFKWMRSLTAKIIYAVVVCSIVDLLAIYFLGGWGRLIALAMLVPFISFIQYLINNE